MPPDKHGVKALENQTNQSSRALGCRIVTKSNINILSRFSIEANQCLKYEAQCIEFRVPIKFVSLNVCILFWVYTCHQGAS
jgi:hypothetical protein